MTPMKCQILFSLKNNKKKKKSFRMPPVSALMVRDVCKLLQSYLNYQLQLVVSGINALISKHILKKIFKCDNITRLVTGV